jgi:hypothetical protein
LRRSSDPGVLRPRFRSFPFRCGITSLHARGPIPGRRRGNRRPTSRGRDAERKMVCSQKGR